MDNERIAELLADKVFGAGRNDTDMAVQLFVERVVLPKGCEGYTATKLYTHILDKLSELEAV